MDEEKVNKTLQDASGAANTVPGTTNAQQIANQYDANAQLANAATASAATPTATPTTTTTPYQFTVPQSTVNVDTSNPIYDADRVNAINNMYNSNLNSQVTALQESGQQALSDAQANRDKIASTYQTQRNINAVNWERNRRNWLESANMNGVNSGANSQYRLHSMAEFNRNQNVLGGQQAAAETAADKNIADIQRQTQAQINEAVANNDYKKAAALLDEYNTAYSRAVDRAKTLAQYGDFSGYATIFGEDEALKMAYNWYAQDPNLAFMMGAITSDQRDNLLHNRPINEGLDASGKRIKKAAWASSGGGGFQRATSDILREQANSVKWAGGKDNSSSNMPTASAAAGKPVSVGEWYSTAMSQTKF